MCWNCIIQGADLEIGGILERQNQFILNCIEEYLEKQVKSKTVFEKILRKKNWSKPDKV